MLSTARLNILPLTHRQLATYLQGGNIFEEEMGLSNTGRVMNAAVKSRVEKFTLPFMRAATQHNYLYFTFWIVVEKAGNRVVAELGFKGLPNLQGEIEIGYGTLPAYRGKGFMTEAVGALLGWAARQPDVRAVLAETDKDNSASIRVVQKNGFAQFDRKEPMLWWKKELVNLLIS